MIQNHAARVITRTKEFDHISGVLKKNTLVTNQGENRLQSTTIGIQMSDGYWTIISEGTPINENIFMIQHEILKVYTTTK